MSEVNGGYGRDGDMEAEIAEILAECSSGSDTASSAGDDISEMARRYGVKVPERSAAYEKPLYGGYVGEYPREGYGASAVGRAPSYQYPPVYYPPAPRQEYDKNGGRIVYDADSQPGYGGVYGGTAPVDYARYEQPKYASPDKIPSAAARRRAHSESDGVKVVYDADTSPKTAGEAPFENIGDKSAPVKVSDGRDKTLKKAKKPKKSKSGKKGEMTKGKKALKVFIPWNGDSTKEKTRKIIMDVSFFVLFFCAIYFMNYFVELNTAHKVNNENKPAQTDTAQDDLSARWAAIKAKYPNVNFPDGMNIDYAELYAKNQDFVGWISINNTNIDAPVVQADDNEYYLKHDFLKNETKYGNSFMDFRNNTKEIDRNTIIYGHHMRDNMLFAQLEKYLTVDGFKESPTIDFNTLYNNYTWKVYAVFITNDSREDDNGYMFNFIVPNFHTVESFTSYTQALNERRLYDTGVDINENDKILTLSTCAYDFDNARLVVVARLLRDGESHDVDVEKAVVNENPRYPQKWYDVKGLDNPYVDAFRWEPNT